MNPASIRYLRRMVAAAMTLLLAAGCGVLPPKSAPPPAFFTLDGPLAGDEDAVKGDRDAATMLANGPTLIVNQPRAGAGADSRHIVYVRKANQLEAFAHSEWIDTPARMLAPLIVAALEGGGAFRAVVATPSSAAGELRLDTEIVRLRHEFGALPSRVRLTLRATITDNLSRRVLAQRDFDETVPSASEDAYGGVVAAHRATRKLLAALAGFCNETARNWRRP
jgi:cholesterol transport system auxiliary component